MFRRFYGSIIRFLGGSPFYVTYGINESVYDLQQGD